MDTHCSSLLSILVAHQDDFDGIDVLVAYEVMGVVVRKAHVHVIDSKEMTNTTRRRTADVFHMITSYTRFIVSN